MIDSQLSQLTAGAFFQTWMAGGVRPDLTLGAE